MTAAPSPEALSAARDLIFEAIVEGCSLAESYARCASEAAWRGDQLTLGVHVAQLRACVVEVIRLRNDLAVQAEGKGAA